eukprot:3757900-Pyramimonas_sp.AAC.1
MSTDFHVSPRLVQQPKTAQQASKIGPQEGPETALKRSGRAQKASQHGNRTRQTGPESPGTA